MNIKFKKQKYQTEAVESVIKCFKGQSKKTDVRFIIDPGKRSSKVINFADYFSDGVKNNMLEISEEKLLLNIQKVQEENQVFPKSKELIERRAAKVNLEIEMETGTGKTYVYIKTMFELYEKYGWSKFVIVVPSIAIREGVYKSFELTRKHFQEQYSKQVRVFIYDTNHLQKIQDYSMDSGINVMIINVQSFNTKSRNIFRERDSLGSRRAIDLIKSCEPIVIIDEPQKIGENTKGASFLEVFNPLFILSYSATHKEIRNKIHALDAIQAYEMNLVKKIQVTSVFAKGFSGNGYIYLQEIIISNNKPPQAKIEIQVKQKNRNPKKLLSVSLGDNLYNKSNELEQYRGMRISNINWQENCIELSNGLTILAGEVIGDVSERRIRRLQIRESIKSHLEKEKSLFLKGIKVLSLFFIDKVSNYRDYGNIEDTRGEYARCFEEEYIKEVKELKNILTPEHKEYIDYIDSINVKETHNGYFSQDRNQRFIETKPGNSKFAREQAKDTYDLILKDKELLLDLDPYKSPVRFIFSHSALREGWDNPNVFVLCTLKKVDTSKESTRRQEIGRGLRISVDKDGNRTDDPSIVNEVNVLTLVTDESFGEYANGLQKEIFDTLPQRKLRLDNEYFLNRQIKDINGREIRISDKQSQDLEYWLIKNNYINQGREVTKEYINDKRNDSLKPLPNDLEPYISSVIGLIDYVTDANSSVKNMVTNNRKHRVNPRNENFNMNEFKELWKRISKKAVYSTKYDSKELIKKCIKKIDDQLSVQELVHVVTTGEFQEMSEKGLADSKNIKKTSIKNISYTDELENETRYDLIGKISKDTNLTRKTIGTIIGKISPNQFNKYRKNPEDFISATSRLINEERESISLSNIKYSVSKGSHDIEEIFTINKENVNFSRVVEVKKHIYNYVEVDSDVEKDFVLNGIDIAHDKVAVYAKLPMNFFVPTPAGNYSPDWAIAFKKGSVKHVYFIAETKGSNSDSQLKEDEKHKIECAKKYFKEVSDRSVVYERVDSYDELLKKLDS